MRTNNKMASAASAAAVAALEELSGEPKTQSWDITIGTKHMWMRHNVMITADRLWNMWNVGWDAIVVLTTEENPHMTWDAKSVEWNEDVCAIQLEDNSVHRVFWTTKGPHFWKCLLAIAADEAIKTICVMATGHGWEKVQNERDEDRDRVSRSA